ncbi:MAG: dihydroorotate dehydrogenase electron transfer subunit [Planctomycetaceae bacterium]|nr:dihydroorotate dehydrogenase electron transfer subunit [Planctomycetaceae bacterium]
MSIQLTGHILSQRELADHTYCLRVHAPELARVITPGQFFMIRPADGNDPLLGRPFAIYDVIRNDAGEPTAIEFVYHTIGKLTDLMSSWSGGEQVALWGPLGNGFPLPDCEHLLCVGGGIGYTPFPAVLREALGHAKFGSPVRGDGGSTIDRATFCYGARNAAQRADLEGLDQLSNLDIEIATDDGSQGHHGFVTDLVRELLRKTGSDRPDAVYCCGPEPMMRAVASLCAEHSVDCWLSLETPMACGFGACFSCVTKVKTDDGWDYRRTCVEGPIFKATDLDLESVDSRGTVSCSPA